MTIRELYHILTEHVDQFGDVPVVIADSEDPMSADLLNIDAVYLSWMHKAGGESSTQLIIGY